MAFDRTSPSALAAACSVAIALLACGGGSAGGQAGAGDAAGAGAGAAAGTTLAQSRPDATADAGSASAPAAAGNGATPAAPDSGTTVNVPGSAPTPVDVTADAARVPVGKAVALELARAGALRTLDAATTRYRIAVPADANGLIVAPGAADGHALVGGTPQSARTVTVTVTAVDAGGTTHVQPVRIAAVRTSTAGAPDVAALAASSAVRAPAGIYATDPALQASDNTPADNPATAAGVALGRTLFYDTRLSYDGSVACASCHVQSLGFADPSRLSVGVFGKTGTRHSPSLVNLRFQADGRMFWDEHATSLETQALEPIQNTREMASSLGALVTTLKSLPFYAPMFASAFGTPDIDAGRVARALAQFQRQIVSTGSRFDAALATGDANAALSDQELLGRALFEPVDAAVLAGRGLPPVQSLGCSGCHRGPAQAGSLAAAGAPDADPAPATANVGLDALVTDPGASRTGDFKVPTLRNVARTAPYMHDGRFDTLEQVVRFFADGVRDTPQTSRFLREGNDAAAPVRRRTLDDAQVAALVAFLGTLSDDDLLADARFSDPFTQ